MIFRKNWQRVFVLRYPTVIKSDYHRQCRQLTALIEIICNIRERDYVVSVVLQKFHLLIEHFGGYRHSPQPA